METVILNVRECSVRLWRCDLDSRMSVPLAEGGVPAAHPEPMTPVASHALDHNQGDTRMLVMVIKTEHDAEDALTTQEAGVALARVPASLVSDVNWLIKDEHDIIAKTEDEADEVMVKYELEIGPTVLQQQSTPFMPSLTAQVDQGPRSSPSCGCVEAPAPPCTAYAPPKLRTEAEDNCYQENSKVPPSAISIKLESKRAEDCCQGTAMEHPSDCSGSEDTSTGKQVGDRRRCSVKSLSEHYSERTKITACTSGKQYECHYCKYITKRKCHLINHLRKHTDDKLYKYQQWEYRAFQLNSLKVHTGEKFYECEKCEYRASQKGHLKSHMRIHTGEKPYDCQQCEYRSSQLSSLKTHMRIHTGEKPYKCDQCDYSASQLNLLKAHMFTHTGEKPYKCDQCDHSASQQSNLNKHKLTHMGEKPYKCEQCDYSVSRRCHLKVHKRIHTGEKPYKCQQCEYRASRKSHLKRHMRIHTGEKPYKCKQCEYQASQKHHVKRHMRIHAGEKRYKCGQCLHMATSRNALSKHMRIHAGEKRYKCGQ